MADSLEMPDSCAGFRIQGEQAIGEKIVANPISAVEIKRGGARGSVENSTRGIERHSSPIICGAAGLPGILRPGLIPKFAGMWNGVKRPSQLAGSNVIRANVAGRRGESLRIAAAEDHQILVNDTRAGQIDRLRSGGFAAQIFAEVDAAPSFPG